MSYAEVMRNVPHESWIGIQRTYLRTWMRRDRLSRETVVDHIVEAYERLYTAQGLNEVRFESRDRDPVTRMKVNAERVFRWLDDETKDNNLLGANFVLPILAAMPADLRISCANELLLPAHMGVRLLERDGQETDVVSLLKGVMKECGDVEKSLVSLMDGASEEVLLEMQREVAEAEQAIQRVRSTVEIKLSRLRA